ncbi:MAG: hypothetical protein IKK91_03215 [Ruminococcus sp.]|nr:hypothetical protein [Ruminococcus sp.]
MAKNRRRGIEEARKALYEIVNEIEVENGIQILQNNEKLDDLAARITATTKTATYAEFLSELYFRVAQLKDAIKAEITAIKNSNIYQNGYVLAINI